MSNKTSPQKERLDVLILERGLVASRTKAQAVILAGQVKVNGVVVRKVGTPISIGKTIELIASPRYVSRGGEKLEGALKDFKLSPKDLICLDVGSSTGGFTDCLLQHGAKLVYAVDVGTHQLASSLKKDPRIISMEQTHILDFNLKNYSAPSLAVIDVSFISLKRVLPKIKTLMSAGSHVAALIKPQFEVGPKFLKKGVVRSEVIQKQAVQDIVAFAKNLRFEYLGEAPSHLKGPKGNQEYFVHLMA